MQGIANSKVLGYLGIQSRDRGRRPYSYLGFTKLLCSNELGRVYLLNRCVMLAYTGILSALTDTAERNYMLTCPICVRVALAKRFAMMGGGGQPQNAFRSLNRFAADCQGRILPSRSMLVPCVTALISR